MSQFDAERYVNKSHNEKCSIISITSHGDEEAQIYSDENNGIEDVLRLQFNDTDDGDGITEEDAQAITEFSKSAMKLDRLIVHCGAGRSRSAGVAAAIMKFYCHDDTSIFNSTKYNPNMRCYRKVLECLNELYEDAKEMLDRNFEESLENMPDGLRNSVKLYTCCFMQLITTKMNETDMEEMFKLLDGNLNILISARDDLYKIINEGKE